VAEQVSQYQQSSLGLKRNKTAGKAEFFINFEYEMSV